jgi:hypothetical protein
MSAAAHSQIFLDVVTFHIGQDFRRMSFRGEHSSLVESLPDFGMSLGLTTSAVKENETVFCMSVLSFPVISEHLSDLLGTFYDVPGGEIISGKCIGVRIASIFISFEALLMGFP